MSKTTTILLFKGNTATYRKLHTMRAKDGGLRSQKYWYQNVVCMFSWLSQFFNRSKLKKLQIKH